MRKFDEKKDLRTPEGRSPYGEDRAEAKRKPILMNRLRLKSFTLIELLIVLAVIGILAFLLMPKFETYIRYIQLRSDAWKIASDLRYAHQSAITEHVNHQLDFDAPNDTYTIDGVEPPDLPLHTDLLTSGTITFTPMGNTAAGSLITVTLQNELGETTIITVASTTGHVKVE